jgi:hypothetical protein
MKKKLFVFVIQVWKRDIYEIYFYWFNDKFDYINYVMKCGFFKNVCAFPVNQSFIFQ